MADLLSFLTAALAANTVAEIDSAIEQLEARFGSRMHSLPLGGRANNRGIIEVATDPGRCLIERVTNATDAILENEFLRHKGIPECHSPREAAQTWLGVPPQGLSHMTPAQRRELARRINIAVEEGESKQSRTLSIRDYGVGLTSSEMPHTILSLNESNKISKRYLAGTYGQGGSSTFAVSELSLIVSRKREADHVCFTLVEYLDLPADEFKTGHYVYMVLDDAVMTLPASEITFEPGTLVKHFGFDLSHYSGVFDPGSVYGLLNRYLFDPICPVILQNKIAGWNRTIKGSRNSLNGAVDEGDDGKGPSITHTVPKYMVSLGDWGSIGIEYWLLEASDTNKNPVRAYVDHNRPIVITHNGQNQGELSQRLIKKEMEFPYLAGRLICHVNCDALTPEAKRKLFTSTREQTRGGFVYDAIVEQIVNSLKNDEELERANDEAREASLRKKDEAHEREIRSEVSRLLRLHGVAIAETMIGSRGQGTTDTVTVERRQRTPLPPIPITEPPTFVQIVGPKDSPLTFYPGQRKYVRIITNANSTYHDADDLTKSRFTFIVGEGLKLTGTTPLKGGRMRMIVDCVSAEVGQSGSLAIELKRFGAPGLSDAHEYIIVDPPKKTERKKVANVPDFDVIPVDGPEDANWRFFPEDANASDVASAAEMDSGVLRIYYSLVYPQFASEVRSLEVKDPKLARTFRARYEVWLAVHSLLLYQDQVSQEQDITSISEEVAENIEQRERTRIAALAVLMAKREALVSGMAAGLEDD
ncbi:MAG TPA: hypothetical protein VG328_20535 [Stellaceae bacterium]|jgi:hypothetical protein|nr:hypothetical protein [Stellaceae bacterium]